jgi:hypothetical protein
MLITVSEHISLLLSSGPYYPLVTIGNVPRAYDILGPMKEWKKKV